MLGCPIDVAFSNDTATIVKKKKKKDKREIVYDNELKPQNYFDKGENNFSEAKQRLQSLSPYDTKYSPYEEINQLYKAPQQPVQRNDEEVKEKNDLIQISNREYELFKEFQKNKYSRNQIVEGFDSINDNFNDIILFALTGIFFIIFTDYIYKMGKKSY